MPDYRSLPSVTALAAVPELAGYPEAVRILAARDALDGVRRAMANGVDLDPVERAVDAAIRLTVSSLGQIANLSGVILHTGLGRAPLFIDHSRGYTNLEFDMLTGKRGDRQDHVRDMLCKLTGAEDAMVVNNGAGAVLLALSALCSRKEVLLSRGQSVEIGGAFRMPDVIKASGCKLVDVGTTNKTKAQDYADAITPRTAAVLQCHPSNFAVTGFTSSATTSELATVAHKNGVLFINDQGNGAMVDFAKYGIKGIETLPQSVAAGADITIGSGDKLLGGPQCGIILGRKELIAKMAKHPLARALRIDKVNLGLLQETLKVYHIGRPDEGIFKGFIPLFEILTIPAETVRKWCEWIAPEGAKIVETITEMGSGAAPGQGVPSFAVVLETKRPDDLLGDLRHLGYIGRIHRGKVWLDPRTAGDIMEDMTEGYQRVEGMRTERIRNDLTNCWEKWK